jgi:glycosyltransferase involved in cell wall biosynthesis
MFAQLVSRWPTEHGDVISIVSREGWLSEELRRLDAAPRVINPKGSFNLSYLLTLVRLIKDERIDVVIAHLFGSCVYASIAGLITGRPVVGVLHGQSDISSEKHLWLKSWLLRRGLAHLICVSDALADKYTQSLPFPESKCAVIHNGIDTDRFRPLDREDHSDVVVGAVGNLRRPKSYDVLLRAANIVVKEFPDTRFEIVGQGEGELLDELVALRKELDLDNNVNFAGFRTVDAALYNEFDIYASSSTTEGFSLTCVEAMACGLPVVATRSGGPDTIVQDDETGLLVDVQNPEALADALISLIREPGYRDQRGLRGRDSVRERVNIQQTVDAYIGVCRDAISKSR